MLATVLNGLRSGSTPLRSFGVPALTSAACRWQHAEAVESSESDLQEFRDTVRDFAQRAIAPHAAEIDQQNSFPRSVNLWQEIGEFGLHGMDPLPLCLTCTVFVAPCRYESETKLQV